MLEVYSNFFRNIQTHNAIMNIKRLLRAFACVSILSMFVVDTAIHAAAPLTATATSFLEIPSINLSVPLVVAPFTGNTWDFSSLDDAAGFLDDLPMPGQGSNAIIGAHSELDNRLPGPFYNLNHVKVNDEIIVTLKGTKYTYSVSKMWYVLPTDISPISPTRTDSLTLLTCAGYDQGVYTTRLVVRAELIS